MRTLAYCGFLLAASCAQRIPLRIAPLTDQAAILDGTVGGCHYYRSDDLQKKDVFQTDFDRFLINIEGVDQKLESWAEETKGSRSVMHFFGKGIEVTVDTIGEKACSDCTYVEEKGTLRVVRGNQDASIKVMGTCGS